MAEEQPKKEMVAIPKQVATSAAQVLGQMPISSVSPQSLSLVAFLIQQLSNAPVIEETESEEKE